jgi:hypothetical protein
MMPMGQSPFRRTLSGICGLSGRRRLQLLGPAGPDDRRRHRRIGQDPRHGEGDQGDPLALGDFAELLHCGELLVVPVAVLIVAGRIAEGEPRALGRGPCGVVLAREQPTGDRVVGNDADALFGAEGEELTFDLAEQKVVARLYRVEAHEVAGLAPAERPRHLVRQEIGTADIADLARMDEVVQGSQRLVDRRRGIRRVELVEIDVVSAESP